LENTWIFVVVGKRNMCFNFIFDWQQSLGGYYFVDGFCLFFVQRKMPYIFGVLKMEEKRLPEFEYEHQAMNGEAMPDSLRFAGQHYYLGLRMLYHQYKNGVIDRNTARAEKQKLLKRYEHDLMWEAIADGFIQQRNNSEIARADYRKNPCHENAVKIIESIEGVMWNDHK
jgi:hypothetical protein